MKKLVKAFFLLVNRGIIVTENKGVCTMKCPNCGNKIEKDWNYCPICHQELTNDLHNEDIAYTSSVAEKVLIGCFCTSVFVLACLLLTNKISINIFFIAYIIPLVIIIYGKLKYSKNQIITGLLYLAVTILIIMFLLLISIFLIFGGFFSVILTKCGY